MVAKQFFTWVVALALTNAPSTARCEESAPSGLPLGECDVCDREAAAFDEWETLVDVDAGNESTIAWDVPPLRPFDWVRHFGFRHSSTHGRHVSRGIPMEGTSWQNRPYHVDWYLGTLLGDELIDSRVNQDNDLLAGLRIGWDFDYYWGVEWRFGWSDPNVQYAGSVAPTENGSIFLTDIDLMYYPWGDSKVRPYGLLGAGLARYDFRDDAGGNRNTTLATLPVGAGVKFHQWPWLVWRLEALDNISIGADGLSTLHNVSLTAGMELRLGARPSSYWPWRSSRRIW